MFSSLTSSPWKFNTTDIQSVYMLHVSVLYIRRGRFFTPKELILSPLQRYCPHRECMAYTCIHAHARAHTHTHTHTHIPQDSWLLGEKPAKHFEHLERTLLTNHNQSRQQPWSRGSHRKWMPASRKPGNSSKFWSSLGMTWSLDLQIFRAGRDITDHMSRKYLCVC